MHPKSREEKNALAFLDHLAREGGYKLRPPGYQTAINLQLLESRFLTGGEVWKALSADEQRDELHAYVFIQAAPLPLVARAVRKFRRDRATHPREDLWEDFVCEVIEPFLAELAPEDRAEIEQQLGSLDEIEAARVIATPPSGGKNTERPDPNS